MSRCGAVGLASRRDARALCAPASGGQRQRIMGCARGSAAAAVDHCRRARVDGRWPPCGPRFWTACASSIVTKVMSIVYITHDLTTAFQISDNIHRAVRAQSPKPATWTSWCANPSTRTPSCSSAPSLPEPDPNHRGAPWRSHAGRSVKATNGSTPGRNQCAGPDCCPPVRCQRRGEGSRGHLISGCTFADRCPHVMAMCRDNVPPLYRLDPGPRGSLASCIATRRRRWRSKSSTNVMSAAGSSTRSA